MAVLNRPETTKYWIAYPDDKSTCVYGETLPHQRTETGQQNFDIYDDEESRNAALLADFGIDATDDTDA